MLKYEKLYQASMESAKTLAESARDSSAELAEHQASNQELQYDYDEKHEELKAVLAEYQEQCARLSQQNLTKVVS